MKKVIVAIVLVLSLLLTLTGCDGITNLLGSVLGVTEVEENTQNVNEGTLESSEEEEDDGLEDIDNPSANIMSIVSAVNKGIDLGSLSEINTAEAVDYEEVVKQLRQSIKDVTFSKDLAITLTNNGDKATVNGYVGAKDGVIYTSLSGTDTYMFIEDDFKIVTVQVDEEGYCSSDVEGGLYEYVEMLLEMGQGEVEPDEDTQKMMQFLEKVVEIQLPQVKKKDITYNEKDGRYYFSDEYIEKAINEVARKILEDYYEVYPEETPEDIYEGLEEGIAETLEMLNLQIWMHASNKEITGFGFSIDVSGEDLEDEDGIGRISGTLDVVSGDATLKVSVEGTEDDESNCTLYATVSYTESSLQARAEFKLEADGDTVYIKGSCNMDKTGLEAELNAVASGEDFPNDLEMNLKASVVTDKEGVLQKADIKFEFTGEYDGGVYEYDDYGNEIYVTLSGTQTLSFDIGVDLNNIKNNGTIAALSMQITAENFEAYLDQYDEYGYYSQEYSEKYTRKYAGMKEDVSIDFEVISSKRGDTIITRADIREESIDEEDVDVSLEIVTESSDKAGFNIPNSVKKAREEALDNYDAQYVDEGKYYY